MTFPSPILVSALLAGVALFAMRLKALAGQRSMVRVRAKRRPTITTRNQG